MGTASEGSEQDCLQGVRIILVDDDDDFRDSMSSVLSFYGADVTAVASARHARQLLQAGAFNLLLSDIEMPVEDGLSLMKAVRDDASAEVRRIHAAALTAACDCHAGPAFAVGYNRVIPKTMSMRDLVRIVCDLAASDRVARKHSLVAAALR